MKIQEVKLKSGSRLPRKKAKAIAARLKKIAGSQAILTPEMVVHDARLRTSPLHDLFQWDNTLAAEQYRLIQARKVIQSVVVVYCDVGRKKAPRQCRAYYTVEPMSKGGPYISTVKIMSDTTLRESLVHEALAEAQRWKKRYEHLVELAEVVAAIDKAAAKIRGKGKSKKNRRKEKAA